MEVEGTPNSENFSGTPFHIQAEMSKMSKNFYPNCLSLLIITYVIFLPKKGNFFQDIQVSIVL